MKRREKAVTLLELLVVMVIIGIVALIAIPNYQGASLAAFNGEADNAMAIIVDAEKIAEIQGGAFVNFAAGGANAAVGTAAAGNNNSGIDLTGIDSSTHWAFSVNGNIITATSSGGAACYSYDLVANTFGPFTCASTDF
jgi:prepilin-type N-terminal cleavage/methylation domain-containing protein